VGSGFLQNLDPTADGAQLGLPLSQVLPQFVALTRRKFFSVFTFKALVDGESCNFGEPSLIG
jgi:hypothetical protein